MQDEPKPDACEDGSDLFSRLAEMENAEPMTAEDDLTLRMESVTKLKGKKAKQERPTRAAAKATKSISKPKRKQPKRDTMRQ